MKPKLTAWRQLIAIAALGVIGTLASCGTTAAVGTAKLASTASEDSVVGAWHVTVTVQTPTPAPPFDGLYVFNEGGTFARVDGRNPYVSTGVGAWRRDGNDITFSFVLFTYNPTTGARVGTITVPSQGHTNGDDFSGTFTAYGVDTMGQPLSGFPKTGTVTGVRITPAQSH